MIGGGDFGDPRLGQVLGGKYKIERLVGQGGLGRVYLATHLTLGSPVAVKFILGEASRHEETRARFRREAAVLSVLRHPGIVAAYDFGEDGGDLYLVMEFVSGEQLSSQIASEGIAMPFRRIVGITEQILQVLEAAHAAQIVHRDLKPENVMLLSASDRTDHVKVLDFGIALMQDQKDGSRLTATNAVQGTPLYMSPEQCRGRNVGPETDIYGAGVLLYEMLAGDTPFSGEGFGDVMAQHMYVLPPPIADRGVGRSVPPELEQIATWALAKKPEDRPTAAQMRDALDKVTRGTSAVALAAQSTDERIRAMAMSRSDRGLPVPQMETAPTMQKTPPPPKSQEAQPLIVLWGFPEARRESLQSAFGVNGVGARAWRQPDAPSVVMQGRDVRAVVVPGGPDAAARVRQVRANPVTSKLPVLVVDIDAAEDIALLIRAGASDATLASVGDDVVCTKLWRILRRGR